MITIDSTSGTLAVADAEAVLQRDIPAMDMAASHAGMGRELFAMFRQNVGGAEAGGSIFVAD
jgi:phosphogluconate dehydratase